MRRLDLQPDDRAAPAPLQRAFEEPHQILGLLLDFDVAVADDAEAALPDDLEAGKQQRAEGDDDLFERDEALCAGAPRSGSLTNRSTLLGKRTSALITPPVLEMREFEREREAEIGDERERDARDRPRAASAPGKTCSRK